MRFPHTSMIAHRRVYDWLRLATDQESCILYIITSLSSNLMRRIICFMTNLGQSCDSLAINIDTDFGPLRSLLLYSLLLSSLKA